MSEPCGCGQCRDLTDHYRRLFELFRDQNDDLAKQLGRDQLVATTARSWAAGEVDDQFLRDLILWDSQDKPTVAREAKP